MHLGASPNEGPALRAASPGRPGYVRLRSRPAVEPRALVLARFKLELNLHSYADTFGESHQLAIRGG